MTNQKKPKPETISIPVEDYKFLISEFQKMRERLDKLEKSMSTGKTPKTEKNEPKVREWVSRPISASRNEKSVAYAWEDGSYVYDKGVRMFVNAMIKESGGTWDKDAKKYLFSSVQKATACAKKLNGYVVESAKVDEYMQARKNK